MIRHGQTGRRERLAAARHDGGAASAGIARTLLMRLCVTLAALLLFTAPSLAETREPQLLEQPTAVQVQHTSGQTFVTWQESSALVGESYRVYRHHAPIVTSNLAQAALLAQVSEGSSQFYTNRYRTYGTPAWKPRYLDRYVIVDRGPELGETTGLLVWTMAAEDFQGDLSGNGYYAVTTVVSGTEDLVVGQGNVAGPVAESVAAPSPVEIDADLPTGWHAFIQYMDLRQWNPTFHAPRAANGYYGLEETPRMRETLQYAYDYAVYVPPVSPEEVTNGLPVVVSLHAWGSNAYGPPTNSTAYAWPAYQIRPIDTSETWWFGFAREYDYRQGGRPGAEDEVVNYTEYRVLRMIADLLREPVGPAVDQERVYVYGHSMGAGGTMAMAMRYPTLFAAAYAAKPITNFRDAGGWKSGIESIWGSETLNLPIHIMAPNGFAQDLEVYQGSGVWDWQNHQANLVARRGSDMAPLGIAQSLNDTSLPWATQGEPLYAALEAADQCWAASIRMDNHIWTSFWGLPLTIGRSAQGVPFADLQALRSETVPGLSAANPQATIPPTEACELNQNVLWSSSWFPWDGPPVDTPNYWQMSLCLADVGTPAFAAPSALVTQTVTLTPRRLQRLVVAPGQSYGWRNQRIADGTVASSGVMVPDADGLITLSGIEVTAVGNRISIWRLGLPHVHLPIVLAP